MRDPRLIAVHALLSSTGPEKARHRTALSAREILALLPPYRNRVLGHAPPRSTGFYAESSETLLAGLVGAWEHDVFWPGGSRLVYLDQLEVDARGRLKPRVLDLMGDVARLAASELDAVSWPRALPPRRLYVRVGQEVLPLYPFVLFLGEEPVERVFFFSSFDRSARFVDYTTSREPDLDGIRLQRFHPTLEEDLASFLRRGPGKGPGSGSPSVEDRDAIREGAPPIARAAQTGGEDPTREPAWRGRARALEENAAAWGRALESIADRRECPLYDGLRMVPQPGLAPIGREPDSGLWEFAHLETGDAARLSPDGTLIPREESGLVLVLLPGGTFAMGASRPTAVAPYGSPNVDPQAEDDESPVHSVTLAPFFLSKYPMTQGQWLKSTGANPSHHRPDPDAGGFGLLHPVEMVSWEECERVLRRLGLGLPTEAQWEFAARARTTTVWWTGDDEMNLRAVVDLPGSTAPHPIGSSPPNRFGLHDIIGNVWQWCLDWYGPYTLPVRPGGGERVVPDGRFRVFRGAGFASPARAARSAFRFNRPPTERYHFLGVRPARSVAP